MRVCDRCRMPRELVVVMQDAMTNPIELCPPCISDFFAWVTAGKETPRSHKRRARPTSDPTAEAAE